MGEWLSFISLSGFFIAGLAFLYNKGYERANRFLALFLFLGYLFTFIQYATGYSSSLALSAVMMTGFPSLFYLVGPMGLFYVRSILRDDVKLSHRDLLHFLPFLVIAIGTIPHVLTPWQDKLLLAQRFRTDNWNWMSVRFNFWMPDPVNQLLRPTHSLAYFIYTAVLLIRFFKAPPNSGLNSTQLVLMRNWLFSLIGASILLNISYLMFQVRMVYEPDHRAYLDSRPLSITFSVLFGATIQLVVLLFPQILYGLPNARHSFSFVGLDPASHPAAAAVSLTADPAPSSLPHDTPLASDITHERSESTKWTPSQILTNDYINDIRQRLNDYIESGALSNPTETIRDLATQSDIPPHHLQYYFSHILGQRYSDWKNGHRIERVLEQLRADPDTPYTLETLARNAGFEHRSTFVAAFRKVKGMLPREYLKQNKTI